jgi:hypothetical protein
LKYSANEGIEIDPAVYHTAAEYFALSYSPISSVNLLSGSTYIQHLATEARAHNGTSKEDIASAPDLPKWSLVVQDCFSGGSVPGEMFTRDFWLDLTELVERDGIVAMVRIFGRVFEVDWWLTVRTSWD